MTDQFMELDGVILEAFLLHVEADIRRKVEAEMEQAEQRRSDFLRQFLDSNEHDPEWTERRDRARAAEEQRRAEIVAARRAKKKPEELA